MIRRLINYLKKLCASYELKEGESRVTTYDNWFVIETIISKPPNFHYLMTENDDESVLWVDIGNDKLYVQRFFYRGFKESYLKLGCYI